MNPRAPRTPRTTNNSLKKIVFVDLSYHQKTLSTAFLLDELKQKFEVQVIFEEAWCDAKPFPDLSFVDEEYHALILFQSLIPIENLKKVKNNNVIFVPMYDGVLHTRDFWEEYRDLKIINFSSTLHQRLLDWGFNSVYAQYFPEVGEFLPGDAELVFFWQRRTDLGFNKVKNIFNEDKFRIHIHKALDPDNQFVEPHPADQNRFGLTYSEWFDKKEDLTALIKQRGIYVAPREFEGIGMSFLEAMTYGKAVVAADNPTMNEYIAHGRTGYLFDFDSPKQIDFSNIREVQSNTYEYMREGRKRWELDKGKIIDFIARRP